MQIEILEVGRVERGAKGVTLEVKYSQDGKKYDKKLYGFGGTKDVIGVLKDASPGDMFEIKLVKKGDFWNWEACEKVDGKAAVESKKSFSGVKNTYETPEERKLKQRYIVRQSSVGYALEFMKFAGGKPSVEDVLAKADIFYNYVMGNPEDVATGGDGELGEDDIPWAKE